MAMEDMSFFRRKHLDPMVMGDSNVLIIFEENGSDMMGSAAPGYCPKYGEILDMHGNVVRTEKQVRAAVLEHERLNAEREAKMEAEWIAKYGDEIPEPVPVGPEGPMI